MIIVNQTNVARVRYEQARACVIVNKRTPHLNPGIRLAAIRTALDWRHKLALKRD